VSSPNGDAASIIAVMPCGPAAIKTITASCGKGGGSDPDSYVSIYPNPVNDILYIEIDAAAAESMLPVKVSGLVFDVHLYDGQGVLIRNAKTRGGTVEFNISNLPDGFYYVHVYDGVSSTPVMQQVIVEH